MVVWEMRVLGGALETQGVGDGGGEGDRGAGKGITESTGQEMGESLEAVPDFGVGKADVVKLMELVEFGACSVFSLSIEP